MKKFYDIPINQKLIISMFLLIIVPLIITYIYINNQLKKINIEHYSEIAFQVLKDTSDELGDITANTEDLSIRILANNDVQQLFRTIDDKPYNYNRLERNISLWLNDLIGTDTDIDSVVISRSDRIYFQYSHGIPVYEENSLYVENAIRLKGRSFFTNAHKLYSYSKVDHDVISLYRVINDFNKAGKQLATVSISVSEEAISNNFESINVYQESDIFLINENLNVISSPNKDDIGSDFSNMDYIQKAIALKSGYFVTELAKEKQIVIVHRIDPLQWYLVQIIPEKNLIPMNSTVNRVIGLTITLCILFCIFYSVIQHFSIIKPIYKIIDEMKKIKKGNFKVILNAKPRDEIGEINRGFIDMANQLEKTINEVYLGEIKTKEAQLIAMEAQINPHFIYNTLDSIRWLAVKNKDFVVNIQLEALADVFRHVLSKGKEIISISEEVEFIKSYILLQEAKYSDRIKFIMEIEDNVLLYKTPKLILQPLVENAILHGLDSKIEGGFIEVSIHMVEDVIIFCVTDNGIGVDQSLIRERFHNDDDKDKVFALKNIDERIKLKYGSRFGMVFSSEIGVGTKVEVVIPIIN
jgi:two-component system sensor histidine kinase YesM